MKEQKYKIGENVLFLDPRNSNKEIKGKIIEYSTYSNTYEIKCFNPTPSYNLYPIYEENIRRPEARSIEDKLLEAIFQGVC